MEVVSNVQANGSGRRTFALLWGGSSVSSLGTAVTAVALPLIAVVTLHSSSFQVGLLSAADYAAWIFLGLSAGVLVERLRRRPVMIACDLVRAAVLVSVPIAAVWGLLSLVQLIAVALVVNIAGIFFDISFQVYLPGVLSADQLVSGNSKLQGTAAVAEIGGPALGGALVQVLGGPVTLILDVASYLVSALSFGLVHNCEPAGERSVHQPMLPQIRRGLHVVVGDPVLRPLMLAAAGINAGIGAVNALQVIFLVRTVHAPAGLVGLLLAAGGLGGVLGAVVAGRFAGRFGDARALTWSVLVGRVFALLIPLTVAGPGLAFFVVGMLGTTASTVLFSVLARSYRQRVVSTDLLGRVTATNRFVSWGVIPLGALCAGGLGELLGVRTALWVVCLASLVLTPLPILLSPLRGRRDLLKVEHR
ncbi:MAG TPA: MFS transporter [Pseudonocardiaceae bacterium]|nr:MFS transporter [Pseudonocardiaceae bacterium]